MGASEGVDLGSKGGQRGLIRECVLPGIRAVISGELEKWSSGYHFPVQMLCKEFNKAGLEVDLDSLESNGWQWDWWLTVKVGGKSFTLGGSGFHGGLSFYPEEL